MLAGFALLYLGGFFVVGDSAVNHWNIPLEASWSALGDAAGRMKFVLVVSPVIAMFVAMFFSSALLLGGGMRRIDALFRVAANFILSTMVVFGVVAWIAVGLAQTEGWMRFLGRQFSLTYFLLCPASGLAGATMFMAMMQPLSRIGRDE